MAKELSVAIDDETIKVNSQKELYVPLSELVDGKTVFLNDDGKLTTETPPPLPYAYAFYSADDTSLNFYGYSDASEVPEAGTQKDGKTITAIWTGVENTGTSNPGWYSSYRTSITNVYTDASFTHVQCESYYRWFYGATKLTSLEPLASWDTSAVTTMQQTFWSCSGLTSLDGLASWDTSAVTTMYNMFGSCSGLTSLDGLASWDTSAVTTMYNMFYNCSGLTSLDGLASWDTSAVTTMYQMFNNCTKLETASFTGWNTSKVTNSSPFMRYCTKLKSLTMGADFDMFTKYSETSASYFPQTWYYPDGTQAPDYLAGVSVDETTTFTTYDPT